MSASHARRLNVTVAAGRRGVLDLFTMAGPAGRVNVNVDERWSAWARRLPVEPGAVPIAPMAPSTLCQGGHWWSTCSAHTRQFRDEAGRFQPCPARGACSTRVTPCVGARATTEVRVPDARGAEAVLNATPIASAPGMDCVPRGTAHHRGNITAVCVHTVQQVIGPLDDAGDFTVQKGRRHSRDPWG